MFNSRSLKMYLLVFLLICSTCLQGCVPLVFLAANPIITAAIIAAVPAIITLISNVKTNHDQLEVKRLEAETARTNAVAGAAEKLNQQVVAQRQLELQLIDKQTQTTDPAVKAQLSDLQAKVAQDQQVISQTLNTANTEATNLANDKGPLPGMTSGQTTVGPTTVTPLTPSDPSNPPAAASSTVTVPAGTPPLTTTSSAGTGTPVATGIAPRDGVATSGQPLVPATPATGSVPDNAVPNSPPILGVSAGGM